MSATADQDPNPSRKQLGKESFRRLRALTCAELWQVEVPRFEAATGTERLARVGVVRAVGAVFARTGDHAQTATARAWLRRLLSDPEEKVRRYAAAALPGLGSDATDEAALLARLAVAASTSERKVLVDALAKIGGPATRERLIGSNRPEERVAVRKVDARLARDDDPGSIDPSAMVEGDDLRLHLRGRRGYERILAEEVEQRFGGGGQMRIEAIEPGLVALTPRRPFALAEIYRLRCFDTVGFALGAVAPDAGETEALARLLTGPRARQLVAAFTRGTPRYRIEFAARGHQRAAVRRLADRAHAICPTLHNDARQARWTAAVHDAAGRVGLELVPHVAPDPRLAYRVGDIPAASHPRLAAGMARFAGHATEEVVWDPFCGSGMELVERVLLGGVRAVHGCDVDARALDVARANFAAARRHGAPAAVVADFVQLDFRAYARRYLRPGSVSLILTNPPMGRRVHTPDVRRLIDDLLTVASEVLRPGGRLVLPNPLAPPRAPRGLRLRASQVVDFGGFDCRLELYEQGR
ncbi:MAG: methyltransferase [Planctomycetota bacterium]